MGAPCIVPADEAHIGDWLVIVAEIEEGSGYPKTVSLAQDDLQFRNAAELVLVRSVLFRIDSCQTLRRNAGEVLVDNLIRMIRGEPTESVMLPVKLMVRQSSQRPR